MKTTRTIVFAVAMMIFGGGLYGLYVAVQKPYEKNGFVKTTNNSLVARFASFSKMGANEVGVDDWKSKPEDLPEFVVSGLNWMMEAQNADGSWGAGSHSRQDITDPHAVKPDPGTTAFCALALIRVGNTYTSGQYSENLNKALKYMLKVVEDCPEEIPNITTLTGTQPQTKLGKNIDATWAAQFFTRSLDMLDHDVELMNRTGEALQKTLRKIEDSQSGDGSWASGGWAPVLQSSMANNALEMADQKGFRVNQEKLSASRSYQKSNFNAASGAAKTESAAGVSLYAISSTNRSTATECREAKKAVDDAIDRGVLKEGDEVNEDNLVKSGLKKEEAQQLAESYDINRSTVNKLQEESVLSGFGNNGGEEYLSYMISSESMVITGEEDWKNWREKISSKLPKVQNPNGSWSGHHCITSPVFCTAAVIMTMTADYDRAHLVQTSNKNTK